MMTSSEVELSETGTLILVGILLEWVSSGGVISSRVMSTPEPPE